MIAAPDGVHHRNHALRAVQAIRAKADGRQRRAIVEGESGDVDHLAVTARRV